MYSYEGSIARAVVFQTVAVDEVTAWLAKSGYVGADQSVISGQTTKARIQLLSVTARRYP